MTKADITHEEKYSKAVELIGINNLINSVPIKNKEEFDRLYASDENLNNKPLKKWDDSFACFRFHFSRHEAQLRDLGLCHSYATWVCLLKRACIMYYGDK